MARLDVRLAFRLLSVHPNEFPLLGFHLEGEIVVEKMTPMGAKISCAMGKFGHMLERLIASSPRVHGQLQRYLNDIFVLFLHLRRPPSTL